MVIFMTASCIFESFYLILMKNCSNTSFYVLIFFMGLGMGYWAIFVTIAAEQFGTNLRATVATTVPNFARGALVPITGIFTGLTPDYLSPPATAVLLGFLCFGSAFVAIYMMEETYGKDLDYLEIQLTS
jgi:MFS transporter, putative metabolite:H+ symporter